MCQLKSFGYLSLKAGAITASILTVMWCIYALSIAIYFFTNDFFSTNYVKFEDESFVVIYFIIYIGLTILGVIAIISLVVGIIQQKHLPVIFWLFLIPFGLLLTLIFSILHIVIHDHLSIFVQLFGPFFTLLFLYPWIVVYSYYKELQTNRSSYAYAGIVLKQGDT